MPVKFLIKQNQTIQLIAQSTFQLMEYSIISLTLHCGNSQLRSSYLLFAFINKFQVYCFPLLLISDTHIIKLRLFFHKSGEQKLSENIVSNRGKRKVVNTCHHRL